MKPVRVVSIQLAVDASVTVGQLGEIVRRARLEALHAGAAEAWAVYPPPSRTRGPQ